MMLYAKIESIFMKSTSVKIFRRWTLFYSSPKNHGILKIRLFTFNGKKYIILFSNVIQTQTKKEYIVYHY